MSVMGKDSQNLAKQDNLLDANDGSDLKYLRRGMMSGLPFPPPAYTPTLQLVKIMQADRSPLRKVISNYPGWTVLGMYLKYT